MNSPIPKSQTTRGARRRVLQNKSPANSRFPHQLNTTTTVNKTFRFYGNSSTATNTVSYGDLFKYAVMAIDSTTAYSIYDSLRLNYVEAWGIYEGSIASLDIEYPSPSSLDLGSKSTRRGDTSISVSTPLHVKYPVPSNCYQSNWQKSNGNTAFRILTSSTGLDMVVDVNLTYTIADTSATTALTVSGASAGKMYCLPLVTGSGLVPMGLPTL